MSEIDAAALAEQVAALSARVESLEGQIARMQGFAVEVPEDVVLAISAAVAGYLGHKAKVRQIHFSSSRNWLSATRRAQQEHHPVHPR